MKIYTCAKCIQSADFILQARTFYTSFCQNCLEDLKSKNPEFERIILTSNTMALVPLEKGELKPIDLKDIIHLLRGARLARMVNGVYEGEFDSEAEYKFLSPFQRNLFLFALHQAAPHAENEPCLGIHYWKMHLVN